MFAIERSTKRDLAEYQALLRSEQDRLKSLVQICRATRRDRIERQLAEVRDLYARVTGQLRVLRQGAAA